jgi:hypothetical protein
MGHPVTGGYKYMDLVPQDGSWSAKLFVTKSKVMKTGYSKIECSEKSCYSKGDIFPVMTMMTLWN